MTIETQTNRVQYVGNGATTEFPVPFPVLQPDHLRLFLWQNNRQAEMTTGFTVVGAGTGSVSVRTDAPVAAGVKLTILREIPLTQMMDLQNGGDFNAETLEGSADILAMQIQQLDEKAGRAIVAPESMGSNEVTYETLADLKEEAEEAADQARTAAQSATQDATRAETAAGFAEDAALEIKNLQASATTLAPEAPATADYNSTTGVLSLGIPAGRTGATGQPGKDGSGVNILDAFDDVSELPASGDPGDGYMVGEDLYIWSAVDNGWKNAGPIRGPIGYPGLPGNDGAPGQTGPPGPQGVPGKDGQDGGGGLTAREVITVSKVWTAPRKGAYLFGLTAGGGPGGSGATSSAGGAGATITYLINLETGAQVTITVGAGGDIGVSGGGETKVVANGQTYTAGGGGAGVANSGGGYAGSGGGGGLSGAGGLGTTANYGTGGSGGGMNNGGTGGFYVGSPGGGGFNGSGGGTGQLLARGGAAMNLHGTGNRYGFGGDSNTSGQPGCVVIMY